MGQLHLRETQRRGIEPSLRGKERVMDARGAATRQIGGNTASTTRMGAVALPIGIVLIAISEIFHPSREDPMDFPAVFEEYAHSNVWTIVHLGEYFGFLLLLRAGRPLLLCQRKAGSRRGACALRPRSCGDDGGLLHGPSSCRWHNPQVCGGVLRPLRSQQPSLRPRWRGGPR